MKDKPLTLVILTPGFPADEQDMACLPAQQVFVRALNRNYPNLKIILLSFEYPFRRDTYDWYGNTVITFNGWKKGRKNKLQTCIAVWKTLKTLQKSNQLIGLLSFWVGGCALVGKYYAHFQRLKHFIWILGQDARKGNRFIPLIRPSGDQLVAMSNFLVKEYQRNYKITPQHVIPNGVDTALYPERSPVRDIDVLGVGSLIPLKRYELFVSAIHALEQQFPDIRAVICGKGPQLNQLQQQIDRLGLSQRLTLTGEVAHHDALGYMVRARIMLHTSSYEGFSTVCLEALYAGAHVISFCDPVGSPVENWHIVKSEEEMISKVRSILKDKQTVYKPVQVFTMDDSARQMMKLFDYSEHTI
jgi:glycosyltransferase involved in cell wall biosynthesis